MTRLLVLGAGGMLGHKVLQRLAGRFEVVGALRAENPRVSAVTSGSRVKLVTGLDADDPESVRRIIDEVRPQHVINCIGIIKQRRESGDARRSMAINAEFPHALAAMAAEVNARLVHLSTDCVFSGSRGHYSESDVPDPVDLYGVSKLSGEPKGAHVITLRTSIVGRELSGFHSLLEWFLHQPSGSTVRGYRNAIFSGLTNIALADEIGRLLEEFEGLSGTLHLSADPISKYDLLLLFNEAFGRRVTIVPDDDFRCDRSLVSTRYREATGFRPAPWGSMVAELAADPTPYKQLQGQPAKA